MNDIFKENSSKFRSKDCPKNSRKNAQSKTRQFKDKYFDYYDDVKSHTNKIIDW